MKSQNLYYKWEPKQLYDALMLVIDENRFSLLKRRTMMKKITKAYKRGQLKAETMDAQWHYRLCAAELMRRRYHWVGWECRSPWSLRMVHEPWELPRWDGKPCRLLVLGEQGVGDEILFASCYEELLKDNPDTVIDVDTRLIPSFQRSFPEARFQDRFQDDGVTQRKLKDYWVDDFDAFIMAGNVIKLYRLDVSDFPRKEYLHSTAELMQFWAGQLRSFGLGKKRWIGVSWIGRTALNTRPEQLVRIDPDTLFVDLQYGEHETPDWMFNPGIDWSKTGGVAGWESMMGLVANLDAVVTVPTTILHLAGAMGVKTHVVRPPPLFSGDTDDPWVHNRLQWQFDMWDGSMDWYLDVMVYPSIYEFRSRKIL